MARTSQTRIAVLGALSVEPMTGYGVRQAIQATLGHFWSESFGQIYPTLAALEAEGLVERQEPGATSGSIFHITAQGIVRLEELLGEPIPRTPPRNGLLLRLFFGRHLGPGACRALLEQSLAEAEGMLARYAAIEAELDGEPQTPDTPYWRMTLSAGIHSARAHAEWARDSLTRLPPA